MHGIYYNNFTMHLSIEAPSIHLIFEKGNGSYTKRALFYQDILLYSKDIKEMQKAHLKTGAD